VEQKDNLSKNGSNNNNNNSSSSNNNKNNNSNSNSNNNNNNNKADFIFELSSDKKSTNHIPHIGRRLGNKNELCKVVFPPPGDEDSTVSNHATHLTSLLSHYAPPTFALNTDVARSSFATVFRENVAREFLWLHIFTPGALNGVLGDSTVEVSIARRSVEQQLSRFTREEEPCNELKSSDWDRLLASFYSVYEDGKAHSGMNNGNFIPYRNSDYMLLEALTRRLHQSHDEDDNNLLTPHPSHLTSSRANLWVIKAPSVCRGIGVEVHYRLEDILHRCSGMGGRIVQKYVEGGARVRNRQNLLVKFDVRQWVLVCRDRNGDLRAYSYEPCYFRLCTKNYDLSVGKLKDKAIHLSNFAVQKSRSDESELLWSENGFLRHLEKASNSSYSPNLSPSRWREHTRPAINNAVAAAISAAAQNLPQDDDEATSNCFEFLGFDFLLDDDLSPWLLEVNESPGLKRRGVVVDEGGTEFDVDENIRKMSEGVVKLTVDYWDGNVNALDESESNWKRLIGVESFRDVHPNRNSLQAVRPNDKAMLNICGMAVDKDFIIKQNNILLAKGSALIIRRFLLNIFGSYYLPRRKAAIKVQKNLTFYTRRKCGWSSLRLLQKKLALNKIVCLLRLNAIAKQRSRIVVGMLRLHKIGNHVATRRMFSRWDTEVRVAIAAENVVRLFSLQSLRIAIWRWREGVRATNTVCEFVLRAVLYKRSKREKIAKLTCYIARTYRRRFKRKMAASKLIARSWVRYAISCHEFEEMQKRRKLASKIVFKVMICFNDMLRERRIAEMRRGLAIEEAERLERKKLIAKLKKEKIEREKQKKIAIAQYREMQERLRLKEIDCLKINKLKNKKGLISAASKNADAIAQLEDLVGGGGERSCISSQNYGRKLTGMAGSNVKEDKGTKKTARRKGVARKKAGKMQDGNDGFGNILKSLDNFF